MPADSKEVIRMSPVILCFGALDAAVFAQAAYAVKELRSNPAKDAKPASATSPRSHD